VIAEELAAEGRAWVEAGRLRRGQPAPALIAAITHDHAGRHVTITAHEVRPSGDPHERLTTTCATLVLLGSSLASRKVGFACDVPHQGLLLVTRGHRDDSEAAALIPFTVTDQTIRWERPIEQPIEEPPPHMITSAFARAFGPPLAPADAPRPTSVSATEWEALQHLDVAHTLTSRGWKVRLTGSIQHVSLAERVDRLANNHLLTVRMR
jgi:hypothetical protein